MADMDCLQVEELMSLYLENEVSEDVYKEISAHIQQCRACRELKEQIEDMLEMFPDLEEEVPFFLKNRLHYIPESQQVIEMPETRFYYLKWVAAAIGTFVLFLNLFYFTNIYPPANRFLHTTVSKLETLTVETGAFFERLKESKEFFLFSFFKGSPDDENDEAEPNDHLDKNQLIENEMKENKMKENKMKENRLQQKKIKEKMKNKRHEKDSQGNSKTSHGGKNG